MVLKVFAQMVLLNRSGIPHVLQAFAGQDSNVTNRKRWCKVGGEWVVSFATEKAASWNEIEPQYAILDLPVGWTPCVALRPSVSDTTCNPSTLQWTSLTNPSSDALEQRRGDEEIDVESESSNSFSI